MHQTTAKSAVYTLFENLSKKSPFLQLYKRSNLYIALSQRALSQRALSQRALSQRALIQRAL